MSSNSSCAPGLNLNVPIQEKTLPELDARPEPRGFDFNLDSDQGAESVEGLSGNGGGDLESEVRISEKGEGANLTGRVEEDDYNITVEEKHSKDNFSVENDENLTSKNEKIDNSTALNENTVNFVGESGVGETDLEPMIPGLSGTVENLGGENFEDELDSEESEDDLQIVLNDNSHGPVRTEDEDGEDGEQLVIFADHPQPMMEEQKLDSDEPGAEGERKELGDTTKASEGGGAATTSLQLEDWV
ncbi:FIP1[V]-like protein [Forsythia ovata]|uniref:FIP1[V]-like protein n=1 Tax=Forsythia ovata TaxID=205694 RepID=A0ABD1SQ70_9LAMI